MRQFIGSVRDDTTVQRFLVDLAPPAVRDGLGRPCEAAELALMETDDERAPDGLRAAPSRTGATSAATTPRSSGTPSPSRRSACPTTACKYRELSTLSGGEQKRLALEALLRGPDEVLLLDEPDNYLDVPGKRWLEERLRETRKTVLFVSHDRELLARVADRVVTVEGGTAWVHGGGFATYHEARRRGTSGWPSCGAAGTRSTQRLIDLVRTLQQQAANSPDMAAAVPRDADAGWRKFEAAGPPPDRPPEQKVAMRLRGGRTGVRAVIVEELELTGLMQPFDAEIFYGDRVGVLGANGAGKSHFLRLLGRRSRWRTPASWRLGRARRPRASSPRPTPTPSGRTGRRSTCSGTASRAGRASTAAGRWRRCAATGSPTRRDQPFRHPVGRPAGAVPDPAAGAVRGDAAAARRADRQPRRAVGRGAGGGARRVRRHRARGDPRPLVRPLVRPLPGVRRRRRGSTSRPSRCSTRRGSIRAR